MRRIVVACILLLTMGSSAAAQPASAVRYAPFVPQNVTLARSFPDQLDIPLPYNVLDSQPAAPLFRGGTWYFVAFVVDAGDRNGLWDFAYTPGEASARALTQLSAGAAADAQPRAVVPVGRACATQGDQVLAPDGQRYIWCVPQNRSAVMRVLWRPNL